MGNDNERRSAAAFVASLEAEPVVLPDDYCDSDLDDEWDPY